MSHTSASNKNRTVLITGATAGIGREASFIFASNGWNLIFINRNEGKSKLLKTQLQEKYPSAEIDFYIADFGELEQVKKVVELVLDNYASIDVLINNAAVIDKSGKLFPNGFEPNFSINYLANVLLTLHFKERLKSSVKIIMVSSVAHKVGRLNADYNETLPWLQGYGNSKLALNLFVNYISKTWADEGVFVNMIHPGVVGTTIFFKSEWAKKWLSPIAALFQKSPVKAAKEYYYLASNEDLNGAFGKYFVNKKERAQSSNAHDASVQEMLYNWTINYFQKNQLL